MAYRMTTLVSPGGLDLPSKTQSWQNAIMTKRSHDRHFLHLSSTVIQLAPEANHNLCVPVSVSSASLLWILAVVYAFAFSVIFTKICKHELQYIDRHKNTDWQTDIHRDRQSDTLPWRIVPFPFLPFTTSKSAPVLEYIWLILSFLHRCLLWCVT